MSKEGDLFDSVIYSENFYFEIYGITLGLGTFYWHYQMWEEDQEWWKISNNLDANI